MPAVAVAASRGRGGETFPLAPSLGGVGRQSVPRHWLSVSLVVALHLHELPHQFARHSLLSQFVLPRAMSTGTPAALDGCGVAADFERGSGTSD